MQWVKTLTSVIIVIGLLTGSLIASALWRNAVPIFAEPGALERLSRYLGSNTVTTTTQSTWPELITPRYAAQRDTLVDLAVESLGQLGWDAVVVGETDGASETVTITAVVSTPLLGFNDDVEIRIRAIDAQTVQLEFTASSRVGRADFGANLGHWQRFRHALESRL